jgi:uncharacterized protein (DUF2225 family)
MSELRKFKQGSLIYKENNFAEMYLILSGSVGVYKNYRQDGEIYMQELGAGDFFGAISLFLDKKRVTTAVALTEVVAIEINRKTLKSFFDNNPDALYNFIKKLCFQLDQLRELHAESISVNKNLEKKEPVFRGETLAEDSVPKPGDGGAPLELANEAPDKPPGDKAPSVSLAFENADINDGSDLFPAPHKFYQLPIQDTDPSFLYLRKYECPLCKKPFQASAVRSSKLVSTSMDRDLRIHYKNVEPMYYDIATCPHCWYSALTENFDNPNSPKRKMLSQFLLPYKSAYHFDFHKEKDSAAIFASHYLALECAPHCFSNYFLLKGKIWLKLSRIYGDCQDADMKLFAERQALDGYQSAYTKHDLPSKQVQQVLYIIGELNYTLGNLSEARNHFFLAKQEKDGNKMVQRFAEDRLEDIKKELTDL